MVPASIREKFLPITERVPDGYTLEYRPGLLGKGKVHFVRKSDNIDVWQTCYLLQMRQDTPPDDVWHGAAVCDELVNVDEQPDDRGAFADLPAELSRAKEYSIFMKQLKEHLYREEKLELWCCGAFTPPEISDAKSKESEADFRARLRPKLPDALARAKDELEKSYAKKLMDAQTKLQKAQNAVSSRRWQFWAKLGSAAWVVFDTVMAGFGKNMPGRRRSLDPALRGIATETSSSSNAKLDLAAGTTRPCSRFSKRRTTSSSNLKSTSAKTD